MAKRKLSKTERRKQSLLRQVRRMESKHFWWEGDIRQEIKNLSPQKAVHFTTETLYKKALSVDTETGEIITGLERRAQERSKAARKSAETRKRKKEKQQEPITPVMPDIVEPEDFEYDATEEIIENFGELLDFLDRPLPGDRQTMSGKSVPSPDKVGNYADSVKRFIRQIFEEERRKDSKALAERIYNASEEIDELIGVVEYSMYMESIRIAGNQLIKIIRGSEHLSHEDRELSEDIANEASVWGDDM